MHYMRYMDDMVIFGSNKRVLHRMRQAISDYLGMELGLELKANWQVFRFSYGNNQGRDLDFMGFRFYRNRTILRKSIMYKATRKARKISKKEKTTILDARQMLSYLGWIDCTDTYFYILSKFLIGGNNMVALYVALIIAGRRTFNQVPAKFKAAVKADLEALGLDENGNPVE